MKPINVDVISPHGVIFSGFASFAALPAIEGVIGVFAGHQPVVTLLRQGEVRIYRVGGEGLLSIPVRTGFAFVEGDGVTVLPGSEGVVVP